MKLCRLFEVNPMIRYLGSKWVSWNQRVPGLLVGVLSNFAGLCSGASCGGTDSVKVTLRLGVGVERVGPCLLMTPGKGADSRWLWSEG